MKRILLTQSTHTNSLTLQPSDAVVDICALCAVVMRGWRLYPRALWIICGSGNKKMHSDYLRVGRRWIREAESTGKSRGGGTCFYINERWCTDVTVLKNMCCYDLETLFINCKPFYSPREFCSFILVSVYIPPHANARSALQKLADQITETEQQHPDYPG